MGIKFPTRAAAQMLHVGTLSRLLLAMGAACCVGSAAGASLDGSILTYVMELVLGYATQNSKMAVHVILTLCLGAVLMYVALVLATPKALRTSAEERRYVAAEHIDDPRPLPSLEESAQVQLSVVVPMYNEEQRLESMLDDALDWLESMRASNLPLAEGVESPYEVSMPLREPLRTYEVLMVDDGSRDKTVDVALRYTQRRTLPGGAELRITRMHQNRGKGAAVRHGVLHARGAFILFADADGATQFSELAKLAREMVRVMTPAGQGIVVGSRAHLVTSEAVVKRSFLRNFLMRCFHLTLSLLMRPPTLSGLWPRIRPHGAAVMRLPRQPEIHDTQCGFKLFARATAQLLFPLAHIDRWIFDVELLLLAEMACRMSEADHVLLPEAMRGDGHDTLLRLPLPIAEVAVHWTEIDGSKIHLLTDSLRMGRDLIVIRLNYWLGRWRGPPSVYAQRLCHSHHHRRR